MDLAIKVAVDKLVSDISSALDTIYGEDFTTKERIRSVIYEAVNEEMHHMREREDTR